MIGQYGTFTTARQTVAGMIAFRPNISVAFMLAARLTSATVRQIRATRSASVGMLAKASARTRSQSVIFRLKLASEPFLGGKMKKMKISPRRRPQMAAPSRYRAAIRSAARAEVADVCKPRHQERRHEE